MNRTLPRLLMAPAVVTLFLWMIVPLLMSIYFSAVRYNLMQPGEKDFIGLANFEFFFTDPDFYASVSNTLLLLGSVIAITVVLGIARRMDALCPSAFLLNFANPSGLIQAAVGFYHLGNGNRDGARRLFDRALARLERYPPRYAGIDAGPLRASVARFRDALAGGGEPPAEEPPLIGLSRSPRGDA